MGDHLSELEGRVEQLEDAQRREVRAFFAEYVFGFMFGDVGREIELARSGSGGGNFLAALGLLSYTEVMGGVRRKTLAPRKGEKNFDAFFRELGPGYGELLDQGFPAYKQLRCGMAHEYLLKGSAPTVAMLKGNEDRGVIRRPDGGVTFVVERYFEDFASACQRLYHDRLAEPVLPCEIRGR